MIDGLWLLQWSIEGTERSGVIVVNEGRALGGNAGFICTGMLSATGENVIGQLHIRQVSQALPPILPGLTDYRLRIVGMLHGDRIDITGDIPDRPELTVRIQATRHAV